MAQVLVSAIAFHYNFLAFNLVSIWEQPSMCGIFWIIDNDRFREPEASRLGQSIQYLSHRRPDGSGIFRGPGIGMVHSRLSLVDLDPRSNQRLSDSGRRYCLVFNGEIYNFRELHANLEARGAHFATTSGTDVILQSMIMGGYEDTLSQLQGMFAFAFYDSQTGQVTLARDRSGIKPLYTYRDDEKFIFAFKVKAFKPWIDLQPNTLQMIRYLMSFGAPVRNSGPGLVPAPAALFNGQCPIAATLGLDEVLCAWDTIDNGLFLACIHCIVPNLGFVPTKQGRQFEPVLEETDTTIQIRVFTAISVVP